MFADKEEEAGEEVHPAIAMLLVFYVVGQSRQTYNVDLPAQQPAIATPWEKTGRLQRFVLVDKEDPAGTWRQYYSVYEVMAFLRLKQPADFWRKPVHFVKETGKYLLGDWRAEGECSKGKGEEGEPNARTTALVELRSQPQVKSAGLALQVAPEASPVMQLLLQKKTPTPDEGTVLEDVKEHLEERASVPAGDNKRRLDYHSGAVKAALDEVTHVPANIAAVRPLELPWTYNVPSQKALTVVKTTPRYAAPCSLLVVVLLGCFHR